MGINRFGFVLSFSLLSLTISGCATQGIKLSPDENRATNNLKQQSTSKQSDHPLVESITASENEIDQDIPALFTQVDKSAEPLMWTNEIQTNSIFESGDPVLVGRLPGQRELPLNLYREAALNHDLHQNGSITFVNQPTNDIWKRIADGFSLPYQSNAKIRANIKWYARHQAYLDRVAKRAEKYMHVIVEETEKMGIPMEIALLPIVESAFQPFAYSHGRAAGIWQFIPATGKLYGLKQNWWYDGRRDIVASTKAALRFLKNMHKSLNKDWMLALAAYNSGWGTVSRAIKKNKRRGKPTDYWSLDLPRETEGYVPKLLAIAEIISNPKKYNITLRPINNQPYMVAVDTKSQIDLALAADLADISLEDLYILNPAYNRWSTDPKGPHQLMVPVDKAKTFEAKLAELPAKKRLSWKRHKIRRGQSLLAIADKYDTTVSLIKEVNNIRGNLIQAGQSLVIPVSSKNGRSYKLSAEQRLAALQNTKRKGKEKITYRVNSGDTFWSISQKFNISYRKLAKWNGLAPRDILRPGQKLTIWTKNAAIHRAAFSPHSAQLVTQKINYRVRRGDSLARISSKFNVNISDLKRWNKRLRKQKYLQPGERITVYVDVTQQT